MSVVPGSFVVSAYGDAWLWLGDATSGELVPGDVGLAVAVVMSGATGWSIALVVGPHGTGWTRTSALRRLPDASTKRVP